MKNGMSNMIGSHKIIWIFLLVTSFDLIGLSETKENGSLMVYSKPEVIKSAAGGQQQQLVPDQVTSCTSSSVKGQRNVFRTARSALDNNFIRFGRGGASGLNKNFLRFGRVRGQGGGLKSNFLRFGKKGGGLDKNFLRFGRSHWTTTRSGGVLTPEVMEVVKNQPEEDLKLAQDN